MGERRFLFMNNKNKLILFDPVKCNNEKYYDVDTNDLNNTIVDGEYLNENILFMLLTYYFIYMTSDI